MADKWKRWLFRSAGFGAGFALALVFLAGGWFWYSSRPKPPKPWDTKAIQAEYDYVSSEGKDNDIVFYYT